MHLLHILSHTLSLALGTSETRWFPEIKRSLLDCQSLCILCSCDITVPVLPFPAIEIQQNYIRRKPQPFKVGKKQQILETRPSIPSYTAWVREMQDNEWRPSVYKCSKASEIACLTHSERRANTRAHAWLLKHDWVFFHGFVVFLADNAKEQKFQVTTWPPCYRPL